MKPETDAPIDFDPAKFEYDFDLDLDLDLPVMAMVEEDDGAAQDTELMRNLPDLITELKKLRRRMEADKKLYDRLLNGPKEKKNSTKTQPEACSPLQQQPGLRKSSDPEQQRNVSTASSGLLYCLESNSGDSLHQDNFSYRQNSQQPVNAFYHPPRKINMEHRFDHKSYSSQLSMKRQNLPRPRVIPPTLVRAADYFVNWMSGECGISLRNFSSDKRGAQIAVLQQAKGVTTGISNSRLGDQLICINGENVETLSFKEIVRKLKSMPRPIALGFRSNPSLRTSPTHQNVRSRPNYTELAGHRKMHTPNPNVAHVLAKQQYRGQDYDGATPVRKRSSGSSTGPTPLDSPIGGVSLPSDEVIATLMHSQMELARQSAASSDRSSTPTLSDDVEVWCKEQEEMHSECIMLITETVMRCEKLQQENMDQVQNLIQFANIPTSSSSVEDVSLDPTIKPQELVVASTCFKANVVA